MARPSVLTDKQWADIEKRVPPLGTESIRSVAREYKVSEGVIRKGMKKPPAERRQKVSLNKAQDAGFVYVIYFRDSAGMPYYKIGLSSSFDSRMKAHQCSSPFELMVACTYYVGNMANEEQYLHSLFKEKRIRGEWFRLTDGDLTVIASRSKLV